MRKVEVLVPPGKGEEVLEIADRHGGVNMSLVEARSPEGRQDLVKVYLPNDLVDSFVSDVDRFEDLRLILDPRGFLALYPPKDKVEEQVARVKHLSPIEVYFGGLQSAGTWSGLIVYTITSMIIAWIGLYSNIFYLVVASMLIAPFASPIMNSAIAVSRGDFHLFGRSLFRYIITLLLGIVITFSFSVLVNQRIATNMMTSVSEMSELYILLPVFAGIAGAMTLVQSERNGLITGTTVGMLVSISLAPPTALVGMSMAIGRWDLVDNGLFSLLGTVSGVVLSSTAMFRWYGLTPRGARYSKGKYSVFYAIMAVLIIVVSFLSYWQFFGTPELLESTVEERAGADVQEVVRESKLVELIDSNVMLTHNRIEDKDVLLSILYVKKAAGVDIYDEEIKDRLSFVIADRLEEKGYNAIPMTHVVVLERPAPA